jgi:hypothetical protein
MVALVGATLLAALLILRPQLSPPRASMLRRH